MNHAPCRRHSCCKFIFQCLVVAHDGKHEALKLCYNSPIREEHARASHIAFRTMSYLLGSVDDAAAVTLNLSECSQLMLVSGCVHAQAANGSNGKKFYLQQSQCINLSNCCKELARSPMPAACTWPKSQVTSGQSQVVTDHDGASWSFCRLRLPQGFQARRSRRVNLQLRRHVCSKQSRH